MVASLLTSLLLWATLGWAASTTQIVLPGYLGFTTVTIPVANTLYCTVVTAPFSLTGATKLAAAVTSSSGVAQTCGFALYSADGATQLAEVSASCTAATILTATGLSAFNIVAGTDYTLCHCRTATGVSATYLSSIGTATGGLNYSPDLVEASTPGRAYEATNPCVSGNPPATTGGGAAGTTLGPPTLMVE